ncbi:hypothetical protein RJT34_16324 [Clitoria ternatea]|uniref:Uncharacterized protein n=1 Tax=Clitoria ternatea TaxID=43366 RepID=A0AAN9J8Z3_CLITE
MEVRFGVQVLVWYLVEVQVKVGYLDVVHVNMRVMEHVEVGYLDAVHVKMGVVKHVHMGVVEHVQVDE